MFFTKGNQYWKNRKVHGSPKLIETPQHFWDLATEYFQFVDDNPIKVPELIKSGPMAGMTVDKELHTPYTWEGLGCLVYEKLGLTTLKDYKCNKDDRYSDYVPVIKAVEDIIRNQKFAGAAAGIFNPNIIAYDLGLAKKVEVKAEIEQPLFPDDLED